MNQPTLAALVEARLDPAYVEGMVRLTLAEDLAGGVDVTSVATVPADRVATAELVARADGVVAGLPVAAVAFELAGGGQEVTLEPSVQDGAAVRTGEVLACVTGPTRSLLTAERTALNLLCHLSGVATATRAWADALSGSGAAVRDTRKTTPGLRALEKYAVRCGGGTNHRRALSEAALVKDNHGRAAGGVRAAFEAVRREYPEVPVEVECTTVAEVREVVGAGADLVLLDNMPTPAMAEAVRAARAIRPEVKLEASGNLTLDRAGEVAGTGVDYLAVGALTHSAPALDIAMDLRG
jgi:nicotinate-nucleotide pyrophosphorylase (carboxylating)